MPIDSIPHRLARTAQRTPDAPAYYVRDDHGWTATSYRTYHAQVRTAAKALLATGFPVDGKVSILGFNRPEWTTLDLATMMAGGAPAGIYTTCSAEEIAYILSHSESHLLLLEDAGQWAEVQGLLQDLPALKQIVAMRGAEITHERVLSWEAFLALAEQVDDNTLDARLDALTDDQVATFIYTSGTTGPPKGVMLTHDNLAFTAGLVPQIVPVDPTDSSVSYLPLSHIAEQMFSLHVPVSFGSSIYFARSLDHLPEDLKEVQPTIVFGVPRIWEKFHAAVTSKLKAAPPLRQRIFGWAARQGAAVTAHKNRGTEPGLGLRLRHRLADRLVFSKLKPALGLGRAKYCVSGAAPISKDVLEWFAGIDLPILEVYGQSEGTGPTTFNRPGRTELGTVGPPIPDCEVKIAADGEIVFRGRNVFKGYYKDAAATAEALQDGWMHSGDLGRFDDQGFLHITGRKKEILITAGGKNIAPKNLEAAMKDTDFISEAVVIGDRRKFLSALVTLDEEAAARWATENGHPTEALHLNAALVARIDADIKEKVNSRFAQVEHIRKFTVLPRQLTVDDGELTPTLKVKRKIVYEHFDREIEAMYAD